MDAIKQMLEETLGFKIKQYDVKSTDMGIDIHVEPTIPTDTVDMIIRVKNKKLSEDTEIPPRKPGDHQEPIFGG